MHTNDRHKVIEEMHCICIRFNSSGLTFVYKGDFHCKIWKKKRNVLTKLSTSNQLQFSLISHDFHHEQTLNLTFLMIGHGSKNQDRAHILHTSNVKARKQCSLFNLFSNWFCSKWFCCTKWFLLSVLNFFSTRNWMESKYIVSFKWLHAQVDDGITHEINRA